jgi:hypothetical protein
MRFTRPRGAATPTTRQWAAAAVALWLGGCGQPEVAKSPDLVQPVWSAPEAEAPVAANETGSDTSGNDPAPAASAETNLDAPAPGADGLAGPEAAETAEVDAEAAPAKLDAADEPPILEEPKPRSTAKASKSKKKKKKAKPKPAQ